MHDIILHSLFDQPCKPMPRAASMANFRATAPLTSAFPSHIFPMHRSFQTTTAKQLSSESETHSIKKINTLLVYSSIYSQDIISEFQRAHYKNIFNSAAIRNVNSQGLNEWINDEQEETTICFLDLERS